MPVFYSPSGNAEMWDEQPEGYITQEAWNAARAAEEAEAEAARAAREAEAEAARLAEYNSVAARARRLREQRNRRLADTDYLMMRDYPLTDEEDRALVSYRQALRDLPAQDGAPWDGGGEDTPWPALWLVETDTL